MDVKNFVVDRIRRGLMINSSTGEVMWSINQITNPSLSVTAETADAVDALGVPISTFNRAKQAEFSAENSLFDLGLLAAQSGSVVDNSSADNTYDVPIFDEITVSSSAATANKISLNRTPITGTLKFLYMENGDGTLGTKYTVVSTGTASGTNVTVDGTDVTFGSGVLEAGDVIMAIYRYEANGTAGSQASRVTSTAVDFAKSGVFMMEVLGVDVCDQSTMYAATIEFPNAKLMSDFDISFATDGTHPFTIRALQNYCDKNKILFRIAIHEAAVAA